MNKTTMIALASLVVGLVLGYFGSSAFAAKAPPGALYARGGSSASTTAFGRGGNQAFGAALSGTIAAKDAGSITLNTRDGSSRVVLITPDTTVEKTVAGSLADLATGASVIVMGSTNSDGSISASSIQLRPAPPAGSMGQ